MNQPTNPEQLPPTNELDVGMEEWAKGSNGILLTTEGLGPCIGIAVYNPDNLTAYLGHFPTPHEARQREEVEALVTLIVRDTAEPAHLQATIRGSALFPRHFVDASRMGETERQALIRDLQDPSSSIWGDPAENLEYYQKSRTYITELLAQAGITKQDVVWAEPLESVSMALDSASGECRVSVVNYVDGLLSDNSVKND